MEENVIEITLSPAKLFDLYIQGHGITYKWIAGNLGYTTDYIIKVCSERLPLTKKIHQSLNELLETDY